MTHDTAAVLLQRADEEAQFAPCPVCRAPRDQACLGAMRDHGAHSARRVYAWPNSKLSRTASGASLSHERVSHGGSHGLRGPMGAAIAVAAPMVSLGHCEAHGDAEPPESTSQGAYEEIR